MPIDPEAEILTVPLGRTRTDSGRVTTPEDLPIPPEDLWGLEPPYLKGGATQISAMFDCLHAAGLRDETVGDILEFGCGTGRLLRHFVHHAHEHEIWGVDIDATRIDWAQRELSPPFKFTTCSTVPTLPFDGRKFSLVFAGSVFTHISELADAWLVELVRVTADQGYLYVTIQDRAWVEASLRDAPADHWIPTLLREHGPLLDRLGRDLEMVAFDRGGRTRW